jgi:membrane-bound ClpP family serine protease
MRKFLIVTCIIFIVIGISFLFLPLGTIGLVPTFLALIIGLILFLTSQKENDRRKRTPKILLGTIFLLIVFIIGKSMLIEEEVAIDQDFEEKLEKSNEENIQELENELNELDLDEEFSFEEDSVIL